MAPNNEPTLEGLPRELLDRVIEYVSDEAIPMLRLVSKHLDVATKDCFTDTYVANQLCVIQFGRSWERLADAFLSMPRLRGNIRTVVLSFDPRNEKNELHIKSVLPPSITTMRNARCAASALLAWNLAPSGFLCAFFRHGRPGIGKFNLRPGTPRHGFFSRGRCVGRQG